MNRLGERTCECLLAKRNKALKSLGEIRLDLILIARQLDREDLAKLASKLNDVSETIREVS